MNGKSARASMLIRQPPDRVFDAFVDPGTLRRFWLADASGPLAPAARVTWKFMVPEVTDTVTVMEFDPGRRLGFRWGGGDVDMQFDPVDDLGTRVAVVCSGFDERDLLAQATNAVEGFSIVLCDLKTLLENGRSANLVRDKAELIIRSMRAPRHGTAA